MTETCIQNALFDMVGAGEALQGALEYLEMASTSKSVPFDDRCKAKVAFNRVNVAIFEIEHALEVFGIADGDEPEPPKKGEQGSLF